MAKREKYIAPEIESLKPVSIGKHAMFDGQASSQHENPEEIEALMAEYGSPLYLVSESVLRHRIRSFRDLFSAAGLDTRVAYSYKTNYLPAICSILHQEGAWAEVVSGMEMNLALALGLKGEQIVFNGPYKTDEELSQAVSLGVLINLDGFDELQRLADIAERLDKKARIGIRINFRYGDYPWTRFGFSHDQGEVKQALKWISEQPQLQLQALHNHSGTYQLEPAIYARAVEVLLDAARQARDYGLEPEIIDLGGGYPSANRLKSGFDPEGRSQRGENDRLQSFAEKILQQLLPNLHLFGRQPKLILEPGRAIVDDCMRLACTVVTSKQMAGKGKGVVVDAGVNLLPTSYWYDHPVQTLNKGFADEQVVDIYGPLCMQIDVIREKALLPELRVGDHLLFSQVGAYALTQSMQFIQPRPAVVLQGLLGAELIRQRESWQDLFKLDSVPQRLRHADYRFDQDN